MKKLAILSLLSTLTTMIACNKGNDKFSVGDSYQGGIIFYIDNTGEHGLIAAPSDQSAGVQWSNGNDSVRTDATGSQVGTGKANTEAIVNLLGPGNYAAKLCEQLVIDTYSDWYLPSRDELNLLYQQKNKIGGFADDYYWSSTDLLGQPRANYAANQNFTDGSVKFNGDMFKSSPNRVRAIRSF
ncbi:MAG TPA: DUF1566 domain-containing protein [Chitinophagaceae bacterium]|nr:DUF1566 domain-containing protein [Chitinophagaceae bacterium]